MDVNNNILSSVKLSLGITDEYTHFDQQIVMCINTVFSTLYQLGIGSKGGYRITTGDEEWTDLLGDDPRIDFVKDYVVLRVKMIFDPPTSGVLVDALKRDIDELTWRINVAVDPDEG